MPSSRSATSTPVSDAEALVAAAAPLLLFLLLGTPAPASGQQPDADRLSGLEPRAVGPAGMSGRVSEVDVVPGTPKTIWVGAATGGVWKSVDGGLTWEPVFDDQDTQAIGDLVVHPQNPDVVWVGSGEPGVRNSSGIGRGVWRTTDGGETWTHLGLEDSYRIAEVVPHPEDPETAYVAAMGPIWEDGGQRGIYRTTDGGETWELILEGPNARTGAADLVMDPENPKKLYASLWEFRRWPHFFKSGGPGSGLFVTTDGGENWREITADDGLPDGPLGRIGITVAENEPEVVYAIVEADTSEILRSDDGGRTWRTRSQGFDVHPRPFYYSEIRVDPTNENRLYRIAGRLTVSEDAGRTFDLVVRSALIHGDVHALWIHPNGKYMVQGNDGGVGITNDRGENWRFVENLPLAQFYEIDVDTTAVPYNIYGGMQDNGSWYGPSEVWREKGMLNLYWQRVGGGDGFATRPDPNDPRYGWSESQVGNLYRFDKVTGGTEGIQPTKPEDVDLRFNWNAPLAVSPHDPNTLYFGSQFVHRSTDDGSTWEVISPDLTTDSAAWQQQDISGGLTKDVTGAENYTNVYTIAPSPVQEGVIWAGTDDGNLHVTRNGGDSWTNVEGNMPDKPRHSWVSHLEASRYDAGTAFAVIHDFMRGDRATYVYRTTNFGQSWERLPTDDVAGFGRTLEQDPENRNLLWLGTEFGLYVSLDGGDSWSRWTHDFPNAVPVRAVTTQPQEGDLVVGTYGRAAYVLDDLEPIRAAARDPSVLDESLHLFDPPVATRHVEGETQGYRSSGHAMFRGENAPYGALLTVNAEVQGEEDAGGGTVGGDPEYPFTQVRSGERTDGPEPTRAATLEVLQGDSVVRSREVELRDGLNRFTWNLRIHDFGREGSEARMPGPQVVPGQYRLRLVSGADTATGSVEVRGDPRADVPASGYRATYEAMVRVGHAAEVLSEAERRLQKARSGVATALESTGGEDGYDALRERARSVKARLDSAYHETFEGPPCQGICAEDTVLGTLQGAYFGLFGAPGAPTAAQMLEVEKAEEEIAAALDELNGLLSGPVAELRSRVRDTGLPLFPDVEPLSMDWRPGER